jgi:mannose-6-phosphate isomerase-like protein (cupin superfamily)
MSPVEPDALLDELDPSSAETSELLGAVGQALQPLAPPPALRERILGSAAGRYAGFAQRLADLFDLTHAEIRALLERIHSGPGWEATPLSGLRLFHLAGGPRAADADCGFVELEPGVSFPHHEHRGEECALVLSGCAEDSARGIALPGDWIHFTAGTSHSFRATGPVPLRVAVVHRGIRFAAAPS